MFHMKITQNKLCKNFPHSSCSAATIIEEPAEIPRSSRSKQFRRKPLWSRLTIRKRDYASFRAVVGFKPFQLHQNLRHYRGLRLDQVSGCGGTGEDGNLQKNHGTDARAVHY